MLPVAKRELCRRVSVKACAYSFRHPMQLCKLNSTVKLKLYELDSVAVEGRGTSWFVSNAINSFVVKGFNLEARHVNVIFQDADDVSKTCTIPGIVEVQYFVPEGDIIIRTVQITVLISCCTLCDFTVNRSLTSDQAVAFFNAERFGSEKWLNVFAGHAQIRDVFLAAFNNIWRFPDLLSCTPVTAIMKAAVRYHSHDSYIQLRCLNWFQLFESRAQDEESITALAELIYASMDCIPSDNLVQDHGCWAIRRLMTTFPEAKRILLQGRAIDVCSRAGRYAGREALHALGM